MKLLIISHTPHYKTNNEITGWGPTIIEINHLATLFDQVVHIAPLHSGENPNSSLPYTEPNIRFFPVSHSGGDKLFQKFDILNKFPSYFRALKDEMTTTDLIHIRCPAAISIAGLIARIFWGRDKPCWVKYAGNWRPQGKEALSYTLQRWWLRNFHNNGVVTVNGVWPGDPDHVHPFNNPCLTQDEFNKARIIAQSKELISPLKILFVGRLEKAKGVHRILDIAKIIKEEGLDFHLTLVGDGPERSEIEQIIQRYDLTASVTLAGWLPKDKLGIFYADAHFLLFPSSSEGWPKVLSEGMAYGVVPLASSVSSIPQILAKFQSGLAYAPDDIKGFAQAVINCSNNPVVWKQMSDNGVKMAAHFTYEYYLSALKQLLSSQLGVKFTDD